MSFLDGNLRSGIDLVIEAVGLERAFASGADLIITGEGEINHQTIYGKVPIGVSRVASKHNIPVVALVGSIGDEANIVFDHGISGFMSIVPRPLPLSFCLENASGLLADAAERLVRLVTVLGR